MNNAGKKKKNSIELNSILFLKGVLNRKVTRVKIIDISRIELLFSFFPGCDQIEDVFLFMFLLNIAQD